MKGILITITFVFLTTGCTEESIEQPAPLGLRIFVSQSMHHGDFANDPNLSGANGIEKADDFCNKDGYKKGDNQYKMLVVDGIHRDAATNLNWVLKPNTTYYRNDGTTPIGTTNSNAVFDVVYGSLTNSIEDSSMVTGRLPYVVTGISNLTDFTTLTADDSCLSLSSKDPTIIPTFGFGSSKTEWAFTDANITSNCEYRHYFYCVEQ